MSIRSLRGNREISPLTICQCRRWPAPGRRGVIAGDVRRGEVGLAHSSGEAGEQPERSGVSGAKERGQGTRNSHMRRTQSRKACHRGCHVREAAKQRKKERFTALFHLLTVEDWKPHSLLSRKAAAGVDGIRWMDYAGNMKNNITDLHRGYIRAATGRSPAGVTTSQKRMETTPARHRLAGGQDRPVCAGENPERSL
ncbi:hypothetical protein BANRA_05537 [Klebsiella pneumoniae]|nr:hypothetical protein BANRA_05537 [Klebsiella pneumoniae]